MARTWHIGTRYHTQDTYREIMDRGSVKPRLYPATKDGKETGTPVFLTRERLLEKRKEMGPYVFGAQMLQNPTADKAQGFKEEWLRYWPAASWHSMNLYLLCDPASSKKKGSDYSAFFVIGLGGDRKYYTVDMVRDRLNLTERAKMLFHLHRTYRPKGVGYEKYGKDADIEHILTIQETTNYRFDIQELGGSMPKEDRIKRLIPVYEQGEMYLPERCARLNHRSEMEDLTKIFTKDEYLDFPVVGHDDMLDCQSRIFDMKGLEWPIGPAIDTTPDWMKKSIIKPKTGGWMSR